MKNNIVIIILTFNSEKVIKKTILAAKKISKNIVVLDSYSTDNTIKIIKKLKCKIFKRKFINYSNQRNFIIKKYNDLFEWQLHLDCDEVLSDTLIKNIKVVLMKNDKNYAYVIKRYIYFLNKKLNFGGSSNWHLRFFPSKSTTCEHKNYDQHFISKLLLRKINGELHDKNIKNLTEWTNTHNKWSSLATLDKKDIGKDKVLPKFFGNNIERARYIRNKISLLPIGLRGFSTFFIKYFLLLGFLDGKVGFIYCFLNSLWFQTLTDAKNYESTLKKNN